MTIVDFTPVPALVGGLLIGLAAVTVLAMNGKIAGISGMLARSFQAVAGDTAWRVAFLVGLVVGGALTFFLLPSSTAFRLDASWATVLVAGFLVGLGTRIGGGCTSGHGVCGLSSGSRRSLVATVTFMVAGFVTVFVVRHVIGDGGAA